MLMSELHVALMNLFNSKSIAKTISKKYSVLQASHQKQWGFFLTVIY